MVDVEQRALRALEQDAPALAALVVEQRPHRIHERQHLGRDRGELVIHGARLDLAHAEAAAQRVVMGQQPLDLAVEHLQVGQIHQPDRAPADLVLVGRADAAPGGADGALAGRLLARNVELLVQRQDQRGVFGDAQIVAGDRDALLLQPVDLGDQRARIEHDAVADHRKLVRPHHAGRQQRQLVGYAVDDERMAGVMTALEANDDVGLLRQPIDDLALAFVAPLRADHHHIRHSDTLPPGPLPFRAQFLSAWGSISDKG